MVRTNVLICERQTLYTTQLGHICSENSFLQVKYNTV